MNATKKILTALVALLLVPIVIATFAPPDPQQGEFSIINIRLSDHDTLAWDTTEPSVSTADIYYFSNPKVSRLCSTHHSASLIPGDDDIYFMISATSCTTQSYAQTDWIWIERS